MVEEIKQEELTREQIVKYLSKKHNVREEDGRLEMAVSDERSTLDPYIHVIDREGSDCINPKGNKITPKIQIHLEYSPNPLSRKLIGKMFNTNTGINVVYPFDQGKSIYAQREAQTLSDVDEILNLAEKYHSIVGSSFYKTSDTSLRNLTKNLAEEFANILLTV